MPPPRFVQQLARNGLLKASARMLQSFSSLVGGQNRLD